MMTRFVFGGNCGIASLMIRFSVTMSRTLDEESIKSGTYTGDEP